MTGKKLTIESSGGLILEAELDRSSEPRAALVICHAHPRMQGTMKSPLLLAVRDAVMERNWTALRFNFRGVGGSQGEFGDGVDEVEDALAAVRFVRSEHHDAPIAILGWSFGAAVAIRAAARETEIEACVAVAPAVVATPGVTRGLPPPGDLAIDAPLLVVCGANDEVTPPEHARPWAEEAGARYEEIGAANHFFWAKYDPLVAAVTKFLDESV